MTDYSYQEYGDGSNVSVCLTLADTFWSKTYFLGGTFIFFVVPLAILVILYSMMALNLMSYPGIVSFARQVSVRINQSLTASVCKFADSNVRERSGDGLVMKKFVNLLKNSWNSKSQG